MRWHVHEVTRSRHQRLEARRAGQRPLGGRRCLDRVDVIVVRARVVRIPPEHGFQHRDELERVGRRRPVGAPQLPRAQVHDGIGVHRRDLWIIREPAMNVCHRRSVPAIERVRIGSRIERVARRQRVGERGFDRRSVPAEGDGLLSGVVRALQPLAFEPGDITVVVQAERDAHAPPGHRCGRIQPGSFEERLLCFLVVEVVQQHQTLVEEPLGYRAGGSNRIRIRPEVRKQLRSRSCLCVGHRTCGETDRRHRGDDAPVDHSGETPCRWPIQSRRAP